MDRKIRDTAQRHRVSRRVAAEMIEAKRKKMEAGWAKIKVEVLHRPRIGRTLGGDTEGMMRAIENLLSVQRPKSSSLLSAAAERIELAAEGDLSKITARDIIEMAERIHQEAL